MVQQGNWPTSWRNKKKRRKEKWLLAAKAHVASLNFREISLWVWPSNQAWFETANIEFDAQQWYENFRVTRDTFEFILKIGCGITRRNTPMRQAISARSRLTIVLYYLSSTAENRTIANLFAVSLSSVCSANDVSLPSPFLWQLRMRYGKKGLEDPWDGTGELLHELIFWHGASFTCAETTSGR